MELLRGRLHRALIWITHPIALAMVCVAGAGASYWAEHSVATVPFALSGHRTVLIDLLGFGIVLPVMPRQVEHYLPNLSKQELGVVIGRRAARVSEASAMQHVLGYCNFHDVSARDFQFADGQWKRGKSCDTFAPFGPVIASRSPVASFRKAPRQSKEPSSSTEAMNLRLCAVITLRPNPLACVASGVGVTVFSIEIVAELTEPV